VYVFTIGHSNHPMTKFLDLLVNNSVGSIIDVRTNPFPTYATWFERGELERALGSADIRYVFLGHLLGGRPRDLCYYDDDGHVRYDLLAQSDTFAMGLTQLLSLAKSNLVAVMCSEENPGECHRRLLIGCVLREKGIEVRHLRGNGSIQTEAEVEDEHRLATRAELTLSLFETKQEEAWRSTRSVLGRRRRKDSSEL